MSGQVGKIKARLVLAQVLKLFRDRGRARESTPANNIKGAVFQQQDGFTTLNLLPPQAQSLFLALPQRLRSSFAHQNDITVQIPTVAVHHGRNPQAARPKLLALQVRKRILDVVQDPREAQHHGSRNAIFQSPKQLPLAVGCNPKPVPNDGSWGSTSGCSEKGQRTVANDNGGIAGVQNGRKGIPWRSGPLVRGAGGTDNPSPGESISAQARPPKPMEVAQRASQKPLGPYRLELRNSGEHSKSIARRDRYCCALSPRLQVGLEGLDRCVDLRVNPKGQGDAARWQKAGGGAS